MSGGAGYAKEKGDRLKVYRLWFQIFQGTLLLVTGHADSAAGISADPSQEHAIGAGLTVIITPILFATCGIHPGRLSLIPALVIKVRVVAGGALDLAVAQQVSDGGGIGYEAVHRPAVLGEVAAEGSRGRRIEVAREVYGAYDRGSGPQAPDRCRVRDRYGVVIGQVRAYYVPGDVLSHVITTVTVLAGIRTCKEVVQ